MTKIQIDDKKSVFEAIFAQDGKVEATLRPSITKRLVKAVLREKVIASDIYKAIEEGLAEMTAKMDAEAKRAVDIATANYTMPVSYFNPGTRERLQREIDSMVRQAYLSTLREAARDAVNEAMTNGAQMIQQEGK